MPSSHFSRLELTQISEFLAKNATFESQPYSGTTQVNEPKKKTSSFATSLISKVRSNGDEIKIVPTDPRTLKGFEMILKRNFKMTKAALQAEKNKPG